MLRELLLIFTLICATQCERSRSYATEDLYAILDRTTEHFKNLSDGKISKSLCTWILLKLLSKFMKHSAFLAYDILNDDTSSNINDEIARYMNDTKAILRGSEREKRSPQNEPGKGELRVLHVHLCKNLVRLIERNWTSYT